MCLFSSRRDRQYYNNAPPARVHYFPRTKYQRDVEKYGPYVAEKRRKRRTAVAVAAGA